MTKCYAIRDNQWSFIKDLLPGCQETVCVTAKDNRLFYRCRSLSLSRWDPSARFTRPLWWFPRNPQAPQPSGKTDV